MATRFEVRHGMIVRSADGEKLGKIISYDANSFIVEKGFFFPKEYELLCSDINDIRGDEVFVRLSKDELRSGQSWAKDTALGADRTVETEHHHHAAGMTGNLGRSEEVRVPLAEEELNVRKETHQAGSVRIRKDVVTEEKTVTVPVTREVVRVERVPASMEARASATGSMFKEETIEVPLREERAVFDKDVVVREELRVTKDAVTEQATSSETLRRETADVQQEGDIVRRDVSADTGIGYSKDRMDLDQGSTLDDGRFQQSPSTIGQGSDLNQGGLNQGGIGYGNNLDDPLKRKL